MARSRETFSKKEKEKQRAKKKQEKKEKREARNSDTDKSTDFEDMIAYVDEFGNITSTPPDPSKKKKEIDPDTIDIGIPKAVEAEDSDAGRKGKVTFFNDSKGYGFIKDEQTQESIFVHMSGCIDEIRENDKVTFLTEKTPKGISAIEVKLVQ
ncbi:cold-shock protein [Cecembia lonarensis]|uniref:Cold shock domain protein CspD n=1 Tax=Cecembia lonarensis (strain CCUG 58316 / KCTC 22772 / LW9) TaxID=1225176 RepID=K1L395_CECL9|nr:cold shock domain-containing protein [Cecembia lonarensis]EKB50885.1 cold shock domain protein CspD [Cecembia lonarensis LW9]